MLDTHITIDDARRLVYLNSADDRFSPAEILHDLKYTFGEAGYEVYAECCELRETWALNDAAIRSEWDEVDATAPPIKERFNRLLREELHRYDTGQDELEAAIKARQDAIIAKKSGRTAADIFFFNHGREPTAEELAERYHPAPCSADDFEKWRKEFLESREYIRAQHPHVLDDTDQETRDWLLSDFYPASEMDMSTNAARINATIESAEWLRECAATWEKVDAVALAMEIEVKRRLLGVH